MNDAQARHRNSRSTRGVTLLEVAVASAALGMLSLGMMRALLAIERSRTASERIDFASRELDNALETFLAGGWDSIDEQTAARVEPPPPLTEHLPGCQLKTTVSESTEPTPAKRVTMTLRWPDPSGNSLSLTGWAFPPREGSP